MLHGTAATVVLLRDAPHGLQTLLLQRPQHRGSFAGAWVFPGGLLDPQDYSAAADDDGTGGEPGGAHEAETAAARVAGVRETEEETGLRLQRQDLVRLSLWIPPPEAPRRYKTWFFLAEAPAGEIRLSPDEHVDAVWATPAEAIQRQGAGTMELFPPTWVTLHGLLGRETVAEALAAAAAAVPETYATRQLPGHTPPAMVWHGDADYPGESADPDLRGTAAPANIAAAAGDRSRRHRLVRDGAAWTYQRTGGEGRSQSRRSNP